MRVTALYCVLAATATGIPLYSSPDLKPIRSNGCLPKIRLDPLLGEVDGMQLRLARPEDLPWVKRFLQCDGGWVGDGGGGDVVGPITVIQTSYSDPVNGNVVLLIWNETVSNPQGVDVFVDDVQVGTVNLDLAFVPSMEPGEHVFRVQESGVPKPSFAEGVFTVLETQPFSDARDPQCEEGALDGKGRCEIVLSWVNPGPLPTFYLIQIDGNDAEENLSGKETGTVVPGLEPGAHSASIIGFLTETPGNTHALYRGGIVETECVLSCEPGSCAPPTALRLCQADYGVGQNNKVRVAWVNGKKSYAGGVKVFLDGELLGKLEANADTGRSENVGFIEGIPPGEYTVGIQGDCGRRNGSSVIVEETVTLIDQSPHQTPTRGQILCDFNADDGATTATWENATPSDFIDVWILSSDFDLIFLETLPGSASSVTVSGTASSGEELLLQFFASLDGQCFGSELIRCSFEEENVFVRGLCASGETTLTMTSAIVVLSFLFLGGEVPNCLEACDADANGGINISDPVYVLNFLFLGGPPPVGWIDQDGDGSPDFTCETAPAADCAVSQEACSG